MELTKKQIFLHLFAWFLAFVVLIVLLRFIWGLMKPKNEYRKRIYNQLALPEGHPLTRLFHFLIYSVFVLWVGVYILHIIDCVKLGEFQEPREGFWSKNWLKGLGLGYLLSLLLPPVREGVWDFLQKWFSR